MTGFLGIRGSARFDINAVLDPYRRARRRWLFQNAGRIRVIARRSMRRRKKISEEGLPPSVHKGGIKGGIRFAVEDERAVIGAIPFASNIADEMEHGGTIYVRDRRGRLHRTEIKPRPFMQPALEKAAPDLPQGWRGAVS